MEKLSIWEKLSFLLLAGFMLFSTGIYVGRMANAQPIQVMVQQQMIPEQLQQQEESVQTTPPSLLEGEKININTAPEKELQRLPGIGEVRARAIITRRETVGRFQTVEDLLEVAGIGPAILEGLRDYVAFEDAPEYRKKPGKRQ